MRLGGAWTTFHGKRLKVLAAAVGEPSSRRRRARRRSRRRPATRAGAAGGQGPDGVRRLRPWRPAGRGRALGANVGASATDERPRGRLPRACCGSTTTGPTPTCCCRATLDRSSSTSATGLRHRAGLRHHTRCAAAATRSIDRFVVKEPPPELRTLLRLGAYQLALRRCGRTRRSGRDRRAGAEARAWFRQRRAAHVSATTPMDWPNDAVRLSYPDWIVDRLRVELGDEAERGAGEDERAAAGPGRDRRLRPGPRLAVGRRGGRGRSRGSGSLDVCAAPGGKATAMAAGGAYVVAADLAGALARKSHQGVCRWSWPMQRRRPSPADVFDQVLIDAPCSGLGALRRRADARWRITEPDIGELAALQRRILVGRARWSDPAVRWSTACAP